ncbi:MAG: SAM-dependent chlorinase/fluorinase, partial [Proteobacteria bacterium]|nr:SAM-dependent chlorinase/fluorinase [Pseudomonadota bacterium]
LRETAPGRFGAWPDDLAEIVYVDHYGNAMTGLRATAVPSAARIVVGGHRLEPARTFADVPAGAPFWYENANGLVEIAVNRGRADATLGLDIGSEVSVVGA